MVILPFMKHGDLHAFLLASRIGENPFVSASGGGGQEELGGRLVPGKGREPGEKRHGGQDSGSRWGQRAQSPTTLKLASFSLLKLCWEF